MGKKSTKYWSHTKTHHGQLPYGILPCLLYPKASSGDFDKTSRLGLLFVAVKYRPPVPQQFSLWHSHPAVLNILPRNQRYKSRANNSLAECNATYHDRRAHFNRERETGSSQAK